MPSPSPLPSPVNQLSFPRYPIPPTTSLICQTVLGQETAPPATLNGRATAACNQQGEGVIDSQAAEAAGELSRNFQSRLRHILFMKLLPFSMKE